MIRAWLVLTVFVAAACFLLAGCRGQPEPEPEAETPRGVVAGGITRIHPRSGETYEFRFDGGEYAWVDLGDGQTVTDVKVFDERGDPMPDITEGYEGSGVLRWYVRWPEVYGIRVVHGGTCILTTNGEPMFSSGLPQW